MALEPKQTAKDLRRMVQQAGNLAILSLRAGNTEVAFYLAEWQHAMAHRPMEEGNPLVPRVRKELRNLHDEWVKWASKPSNLWN